MSEYMKNEILEFLNRHNGGKTAEIAEALAVTDYQARYYLLLLEKEGNDSNLLIVFYVQIMPDDFVMQLHRF
ncbi:FaeA/PapI family transcriptional regulator [Escherichia coli]